MPKKLADGSCPDGSYLHAATGRCRKNSSKKCLEGETRDPVTKLCRPKSKKGRKKKSPKKSPKKNYLKFLPYDRFKKALRHFQTVRYRLPSKFGANDSEGLHALQVHVENTIEDEELDRSMHWGLLGDPDDDYSDSDEEEKSSEEKSNEFYDASQELEDAWIPLGTIILEAFKDPNKSDNQSVVDYVEKTRFLRYD